MAENAALDSSSIDEAARREFERVWHEGRPEAIEHFLPRPDDARYLGTLVELVLIEIELAWKAWRQAALLGQVNRATPTPVECYLQRFPALNQEALVQDLRVQESEVRRRVEAERLTKAEPNTGKSQLTVPISASSLHPGAVPSFQAVLGYELLEKIGQGGMGVVYRARQLALDRVVALKMISGNMEATAEDRSRFHAEAEAVARLQHPHIVQVYEVGEHQGVPYLALEFCSGGSLDKKLAGQPQPAHLAAGQVRTLAEAMQHAHEHGVIHRDLKPHNVLLTFDDALKITDFGLAKKVGDEGAGSANLTATGAILGTPSYMAPEQASGRSKRIGPAADVYALGAILYEMLTGRPPFKGESALDTLQQVQHTEPVPPARLRPGIPRDIETICLKCLRKEPAARYASAMELADDLRRFGAGEPIRARPTPAWERLSKWARRQPFQAAFAASGLLALAAVIFAVFVYGQHQAHKARAIQKEYDRLRVAEEKRRKFEKERLAAEQLMADKKWDEARTQLLAALGGLAAQPDLQAEDLHAELSANLDLCERHLEARGRRERFWKPHDNALFHVFQVTGLNLAGGRDQTRAFAREALACYDLADGLTDRLERDRAFLSPEEHGRLTEACYELLLAWAEAEAALAPGEKDAHEQARQRGRRALALLDRAALLGQTRGLNTQAYHFHKARCLALERGEAFDPSRLDPAAPKQPTGALDWFLLAVLSYRTDQVEKARLACTEALRLQERHFWARYLQGLCYLRLGRWLEAKAELTVCLNQRPDFAWPLLLRGFASSELGARLQGEESQARERQGADSALVRFSQRAKEAEFVSARADFDAALSKELDAQARYVALANRGTLLIHQARWDEAIADLTEAVTANRKAYPAYVNLAQALQGAGRAREAVTALNQAIERAPQLPELYEARAKLHLLHKHPLKARADFEQSIAREAPDSKSDRLVHSLVELGQLLHQEGKYVDALARFDRALRVQPGYVLTQRFRAETLLMLHREAEAGQALDRYLAVNKSAPAAVYQARGLIHAGMKQLPAAIEMYTLALRQAPDDVQTRCYRGWTYLLTDAPRLALADFEACLALKPTYADALAGRGNTRIRLNQLSAALDDARDAEKNGPVTDRLLYNIARIHAQAAQQLEAEVRKTRTAAQRLAECQDNALDCLGRALEMMPEEKRSGFWRNQVEADPVLSPIRRGSLYFQLKKRYAGPPS